MLKKTAKASALLEPLCCGRGERYKEMCKRMSNRDQYEPKTRDSQQSRGRSRGGREADAAVDGRLNV